MKPTSTGTLVSPPFSTALTPDFVVRSIHLKIPALPKPYLPFTQVTTDSRSVQPGSLFVALKGDYFDGNQFIDAAIQKGARGVLFKKGSPFVPNKDVCFFPVENSLNSYRRLAAAWRKEFSIPILAIAGSAGKTTTKDLLAAILQGKWKKVLKTQGSQNGFIGLPMTLLDLNHQHEAAVIEVGIDLIGAMQQHISLLNPSGAVLTAIGPEHLENLRDVPTVAREEGIALSHVAKAGGIVAINLDDPWIRPHLTTLREGRKIPFSLEGGHASMDTLSGRISENGKQLTFQGLGIPETTLPLPLLGKHNASNLLAAISLASALGLTCEEIKTGLLTFKGAEGRSQIQKLPGPFHVVCDYYNAQPPSVNAGLDLLTQTARDPSLSGKRWACLSDMLELGLEEEKFHREIAQKIIELNIENILLYGTRMLALADELRKKGFSGYQHHFLSHFDLAETLKSKVQPGDTILIKGSRGMKMEEVWKLIEPFLKSHESSPSESKNTLSHC